MKWVWRTWAYLAAVCVIVLNLLSLTYSVLFLIPKMQKMKVDGMFWENDYTRDTIARAFSFLKSLHWFWESWMQWVLLGLVVLWGLFEWRVRSQSKPFIRLAALGTLAIGLTVLLVLTAMSLILPFFMALAPPSHVAQSMAIRRLAAIDTSIAALDKVTDSLEKAPMDVYWGDAQSDAESASYALKRLSAAALPPLELTPEQDRPAVAFFNGRLTLAQVRLIEAQLAIQHKDVKRLREAIRQFHELYDSIGQGGNRAGDK